MLAFLVAFPFELLYLQLHSPEFLYIGASENVAGLSSSCEVAWEYTHNKILWSSQD
jgi:hypothetical protein